MWLWKACVLVLAAVGAVACRSTTDAVRTTRVGDDGPGVQKPGAPLVLAGPCGGFETRSWAADPVPLLRDRLRITPIVGLVESERDYNVMAAPHSQEAETRLFLEDEGRKLVVFVEETFRRADDSAELVRGMSLPATFHAEARTLASGLDVAIARPPALDTSSEAVLVGGAFVASRDRTVQRIAIYVNPLAVRAGSEGCADLVNQMIETIAPGERVLDLTAGPRALFGDIVLDVPANHMIVRQEGVDFSVWRIYPVLPFSSDFELLVVYVGDHPNFHPSESAITRQATILGKTTQWHEWSKDGMTRIEALVRSFHLVATAKDAARARTLAELAEKGLRSPEPSPVQPGERDGDGIADASDHCRDDPEDRDGFEDDDGCPDRDNDGDGLADVVDLCPTDPEDHDSFQDDDGCPEHDNDRDRILDAVDKCPNEPENYNGFQDDDGCPDRPEIKVPR